MQLLCRCRLENLGPPNQNASWWIIHFLFLPLLMFHLRRCPILQICVSTQPSQSPLHPFRCTHAPHTQGMRQKYPRHFLYGCCLLPHTFSNVYFNFNMSQHVFPELSSNAPWIGGGIHKLFCCDHNLSHTWDVFWQRCSVWSAGPN